MAQTAIDFANIRRGLVKAVETVTGRTCIASQPDEPNTPRPPLPYLTYNVTTAAGKEGDDHDEYVGDGTTTIHNRGGQRRLVVSFNCFAESTDEALTLMTTLQGSFELKGIQAVLRNYGIAVWTIGSVADFTALLQTGYEARTQMDVNFGVASNLTEDLGTVETVQVEPTVTDSGDQPVPTDNFAVES